jgi:catechol 2,3-dioxygenase
VGLVVANLDGVADFYRSIVGLTTVEAAEDRVVLGAGGDPLLVLRRALGTPARTSRAAGLFHTAIRVPDRRALAAALARIEDRWRLTGASNHRVSEALYLQDPEDNGVEVYCDRPRHVWPTEGGRVQMDTLPLALEDLRDEAADEGAVPTGTDVGHVHLEITDLGAARAFYVDALGLRVRQERDGALFVAAGDYHHHIGLNVWNVRAERASGRGIDWFELVVPDKPAIAALRRRLADTPYDTRSLDGGLAVTDPDGIEVRVVTR